MNFSNYNHITSNSTKVKKNSIYVSLNNNINYILDAIERGASLIVTNKKYDIQIPNIVVNNIDYFFSYWYKVINNININDFKIIGVTGTDGKTTISKMLFDSINEKNKALYVGTLGIMFNEINLKTPNTTPNIETILECFIFAKNNNIKYIILEVSSEGLLANRLTGLKFDIVIFSNLSHEHLNTHLTMENYFNCKKKILKLLKKNGVLITNIDDKYGIRLANDKSINYGLYKGNIHLVNYSFEQTSTKIILMNNKKIYYYKIPFVGIYNIYNFMAVHAAISVLFNVDLFYFNKLIPPLGRFNIINENIIIDFAHTPNALNSLLSTIKDIYINKKIILVLGSQGEKDKSKRKYLGMVADKYCDTIILTSEDPKNESLIDIIFDISLGIIKCLYYIELDRKKGISKALKHQEKENVIVIVGKGMEEVETIKNVTYKHSDYNCVMELLKIKHSHV
jgi:UDP-N-acetylmuramyl-tripeptide synthetase